MFLWIWHPLTHYSEIGNLYSPPHCGFHPQFPVEDEVREAHDYLYDLIDNEGPFEGILGFSQGAEVAASILFTEAMQPDSQRPKPLFKFAVFIGGFPPWDIYGATNHGDKGTTPLRPVLPITHAARIDIPTVHIMGRKDGYRVHAKFLLGLCNERKAKVYDHQGSHMIPRGEMAMENLTSALNWVIDRSIFQ